MSGVLKSIFLFFTAVNLYFGENEAAPIYGMQRHVLTELGLQMKMLQSDKNVGHYEPNENAEVEAGFTALLRDFSVQVCIW